MGGILLPACVLCLAFTLIKPYVLQKTFLFTGETKKFASEAGFRLGQLSEFSLLIALLAVELDIIGNRASQLIQLTTIITFIVSSYIIVLKYPTPIGTKTSLTQS